MQNIGPDGAWATYVYIRVISYDFYTMHILFGKLTSLCDNMFLGVSYPAWFNIKCRKQQKSLMWNCQDSPYKVPWSWSDG